MLTTNLILNSAAQTLPSQHLFKSGMYDQKQNIRSLVARFEPILLDEMDKVALMDRFDTKFVMTKNQLFEILPELTKDYRMLEVNGVKLNRYSTVYFDTPTFDLYNAHVNDYPERYKVRTRQYVDSQLTFIEVKHRTRKDRTIKDRLPIAEQRFKPTADINAWLEALTPIDVNKLQPTLWNKFVRLTLVNRKFCERVTIDMDLSFIAGAKSRTLDGLVIAEVKQDVSSGLQEQVTPFLRQMRAQRVHPTGFSKYAIGVAMLYDGVKKNSLKPRMVWIDRLMQRINTND